MYRMIIIDDDAGTSDNLGNYFPWEESGFCVVEKFYDGYTAWQYLQQNEVDLIISDIKMPVMDGISLAKWLYEQNRREKIIFISGYKDFEYAQQAMEYGVSFYLLKPVTYREIRKKLDIIQKIIEKENQQEADDSYAGNENCMKDKMVTAIKNYVKANYRDVTLESVSSYMQKNPAYISRFFKETTGENLSSYITNVRMNCAVKMLQTDFFCTVYEIGEKVGYSNPVSFSKAFQKRYQVTPSEYRKKFTSIQKKDDE